MEIIRYRNSFANLGLKGTSHDHCAGLSVANLIMTTPFRGVFCFVEGAWEFPLSRISFLYGFKLEFVSETWLHVIWKQEKKKKRSDYCLEVTAARFMGRWVTHGNILVRSREPFVSPLTTERFGANFLEIFKNWKHFLESSWNFLLWCFE